MAITGQFLQQLRRAVHFAKVRRSWAMGRLADAERQVRAAQNDLKRWTRPDKRKRAKKQAKK